LSSILAALNIWGHGLNLLERNKRRELLL